MIFMNANEPKINWHQDFLYPSHKKDCKCGSPDQIKNDFRWFNYTDAYGLIH